MKLGQSLTPSLSLMQSATAWDQGCGYFTAASTTDEHELDAFYEIAEKWCAAGIALAELAGLEWYSQVSWRRFTDSLAKRDAD